MSDVIYRGLKLSSNKCRYFQVKEGQISSIVEDTSRSTLTLTYSPGSTSGSLSDLLGIPCTEKRIDMLPTGLPKLFKNTYVTLNGLKLRKLTYDPHTINIVIVNDSESRVIQNYNYTTIVVSEGDYKNPEFINFLFYSGNLIYLQPIGPRPSCYEIRNFPKIIISSDDVTLESESETIFTLRRKYNDYVIRAVDYQDQFILELRKILDDYGLELVRINKETTLTKTSHVIYQFLQTPVKDNHPKYSDDKVMQHKIPVEFYLRSTDMPLFFDFKNRYMNVTLLTNFCEFKTSDRYGQRWTAAIKWGGITEDFNQTYQQDDNSNFSYQCQFRCELFFYEVIDDRYKFLEEIVQNIEFERNNPDYHHEVPVDTETTIINKGL